MITAHRMNKLLQEGICKEFPGSPAGRIQCFHCYGPGPIPVWGTEILQVTMSGQNIFFKKEKEDAYDAGIPSKRLYFLKQW